MKKFLLFLLLTIALLTFGLSVPALASANKPDPVAGAKLFSGNCAACHLGGGNVIMSDKTLKKAALEKYLSGFTKDSIAAISYQVKNGKNAMPAFSGRLSDDQIADVSAYVLTQANKGW